MNSPIEHVQRLGAKYPGCWKILESKRRKRLAKKSSIVWPKWCYVPTQMTQSVVCSYTGWPMDEERVHDATAMAMLVAWRATKGIYNFHPTLLEQLWDTPLKGAIPADLLHRLPDWCVYVNLGEADVMDRRELGVSGFFAMLNYSNSFKCNGLWILMDLGDHLGEMMLDLSCGDLGQAVTAHVPKEDNAEALGMSVEEYIQETRDAIEPYVSTLLYLCSVNAEVASRPGGAYVGKTRKRLGFKATQPAQWDVGCRVGAILKGAISKKAEEEEQRDDCEGPNRTSPKAHIRRAHWHTYWMKSPTSGEKEPVLKWLSPILVGVEKDLIPTIREVV